MIWNSKRLRPTLSNVAMENFSMKELRQELDNIGADYTACIEKSEMYDLLQNKVPSPLLAPLSAPAQRSPLVVAQNPAVTKSKSKAKEAPKKLSIKSIKERLASLGVDYSGCLEISELVELLVATEQGHKTNPFREEKVRHTLSRPLNAACLVSGGVADWRCR